MDTISYRTVDGDRLDTICWRHYGTLLKGGAATAPVFSGAATAGNRATGMVEAVLAVNPGLSSHGPVLPSGLIITLPSL